MEKVLVTGASGYIASHIVHQLLSARNDDGSPKYQVRGTVRTASVAKKTELLKAMASDIGTDAADRLEVVGANLLEDEGWESAVVGCAYVMHTASPLPSGVPDSADELVKPAVEGVERVLHACQAANNVKRVVMTSSDAAISAGGVPSMCHKPADHVFSEEDWADPELVPAYEKSKTLAEQRAWKLWKEMPEDGRFELVVVNPVLVLGPLVMNNAGTSMLIITKTMNGEYPMYPPVFHGVVDVRDVAVIHLAAMTKPGISGNRYLACSEEYVELGLQGMVSVLHDAYSPQGFRFSTRAMPSWLVPVLKLFYKELRLLEPALNIRIRRDLSKTINELGITYRSVRQTVLDAAASCIQRGLVRTPAGYQAPQEQQREEEETVQSADGDGGDTTDP